MTSTSICIYNKLGVSGKMGSGKSTIARLAAERLTNVTGVEWKVRAFAAPLKSLVCHLYNVPVCLAYTDFGRTIVPYVVDAVATHEDLPYPVSDAELSFVNKVLREEAAFKNTIGQLLQKVGEAFRALNPDYWIRAFEQGLTPTDHIVIEDVRYPNEAQWVTDNFGINCRVYAHPDLNFGRLVLDGRDQHHPSENGLDTHLNFAFFIDNTKRGPDMSELYKDLVAKIDSVMFSPKQPIYFSI